MYDPNRDSSAMPNTSYNVGGGAPLEARGLLDDEQADIVVIGGGIMGCSVALHAAESGARVVVLEGNKIGWGASSRNGGHVVPATTLEPSVTMLRYGVDRGQRLIDAVASAPALIFELATKHHMNASQATTGILSAAHTPQAIERLKRRTAYWRSRDVAVEMLDRRQASERIGSAYYLGAAVDPRGGTINSLAYVRGLARASIGAGARVYEGSRAVSVQRANTRWVVRTPQGSVTTDIVALCTNAYTDDLWPGLRQTVVPVRGYQYITQPLDVDVRRTVLPGGHPMTDSRGLMSGVRLYPDGRLHFSGHGPASGPEREPSVGFSRDRIKKIWPQIRQVEIEGWWSGWLAMNREHVWKIQRLAPGVFAALGCNGRGIAMATILGRELAKHFNGTPEEELMLPFSPLRPIPFHRFHPLIVAAHIQYYKIRDAVETRRQRTA